MSGALTTSVPAAEDEIEERAVTGPVITARAGTRLEAGQLQEPEQGPGGSDGCLIYLPCLDSADHAARCRDRLALPRERARELGLAAVAAVAAGYYLNARGERVDWADAVAQAVAAKVSLPPSAPLPPRVRPRRAVTRVQVSNETTLAAARRLQNTSQRVLALNFPMAPILGVVFSTAPVPRKRGCAAPAPSMRP